MITITISEEAYQIIDTAMSEAECDASGAIIAMDDLIKLLVTENYRMKNGH